jgi:hypothetical protein
MAADHLSVITKTRKSNPETIKLNVSTVIVNRSKLMLYIHIHHRGEGIIRLLFIINGDHTKSLFWNYTQSPVINTNCQLITITLTYIKCKFPLRILSVSCVLLRTEQRTPEDIRNLMCTIACTYDPGDC